MNSTATRTAPATEAQVTEWLTASGFAFEGTHGEYGDRWYRKGLVRVVIEDEGSYAIYRFEDGRPAGNDLVAWDARFHGAPLAVITATIKAA